MLIAATNMDKLISQFEELSALQEESPTAWQLIWKLIIIKGWNRSVFCEQTGLDNEAFYKAKRNDKSVPNIQTLMIICISLDLDVASTEELLMVAGIKLSKAVPMHRVYMYVIYNLVSEPLDTRKEFLTHYGLGRWSLSVKTPR